MATHSEYFKTRYNKNKELEQRNELIQSYLETIYPSILQEARNYADMQLRKKKKEKKIKAWPKSRRSHNRYITPKSLSMTTIYITRSRLPKSALRTRSPLDLPPEFFDDTLSSNSEVTNDKSDVLQDLGHSPELFNELTVTL